MLQSELLKHAIQVLNQLGIEYMVTGSIASSLQREPRSTHDIDIVVAAQMSEGSEKQFRDALRVYEVQSENLDVGYIDHRIRELNLESLWSRLIKEAEAL